MNATKETSQTSSAIPLLSFRSGESEEQPALVVPVTKLIEDAAGLLIYGGPGSGKTHCLRYLLEETQGHLQQIVFDTEGEFYTLREAFPYLLAAREDGDVPLTLPTAGILCERVMELGISLVVDLSGMSIEGRPHYVAAFLAQLLQTPKALWRPVLVAIDEVHRFAPEGGSVASSSMVANIPATGRKRGFIPAYATQNIEQVSKDAIGYLPNKLVGKITMDNRRKRAADDFGLDASDRLRLKNMVRGQFFAQGPAFGNDTVLLGIPDTQTHKPAVGLGYSPPPPPPDAIKEILANFAALPEEAETEAANLAEANRKIAELRERVKNGPKPETITVIQEKPVEKIVTIKVPVPVFGEGEIASMRAVSDDMAALGKDLLAEAAAIRARVDRLTRARPQPVAAPEQEVESLLDLSGTPLPKADSPENRPAPNTAVTVPQQRILDAIAAFAALGIDSPQRANAAVWAGASPRSSGFANNLSALRTAGLIDYPSGSTVRATEAGATLAKSQACPASQRALLSAWQAHLPGPQSRMLEYLWERRGSPVRRKDLAEATGASATSSGFANNLSALRTLGLVDYPDGTTAVATRLLMPPGLPVE